LAHLLHCPSAGVPTMDLPAHKFRESINQARRLPAWAMDESL
jgi:hypothetical protein